MRTEPPGFVLLDRVGDMHDPTHTAHPSLACPGAGGAADRDEAWAQLAEFVETSALLAAIAGLSDDDVLRHRVHREITVRGHSLPGWLLDLHRSTVRGVVEMVHVLGDGDNVMIEQILSRRDHYRAMEAAPLTPASAVLPGRLQPEADRAVRGPAMICSTATSTGAQVMPGTSSSGA